MHCRLNFRSHEIAQPLLILWYLDSVANEDTCSDALPNGGEGNTFFTQSNRNVTQYPLPGSEISSQGHGFVSKRRSANDNKFATI